MAEADPRAGSLIGRVLGGLALLAATLLWAGAIWLGLYRPELIAPYGAEARLAILAVAWAVPLVLTLSAWIALRRARRALAEARALYAETDVLTRRLKASPAEAETVPPAAPAAPPPQAAAARKAAPSAAATATPPTAPTAPAPAAPEPAADPSAAAAPIQRVPRAPLSRLEAVAPGSQESLWAALDFPRSETDIAGFEALRRALADDSELAAVIRTAQHVLSLLAQEGVHLDDGEDADAPPAPAAAIWRAYAEGARGPSVIALGEIEDRDSLALAVGRLRRDPAFRAAAHRFIGAFDAWLAAFVPAADDAALARIAASRSARAFRLLGRATGSFG